MRRQMIEKQMMTEKQNKVNKTMMITTVLWESDLLFISVSPDYKLKTERYNWRLLFWVPFCLKVYWGKNTENNSSGTA